MVTTWIVLLEAESDASEDPIDLAALETLMEMMHTEHVVAIHSPHRYALQLQIDSQSAAAAVFSVTSRWEGMVRRLGLSGWRLQRLELVTPEEFARDLASADGGDSPSSGGTTRSSPSLVLLQGGLGATTHITAMESKPLSPLRAN
jgi:hypothetical protein